MIKQGGLEINGVTITDPAVKIDLDKKETYELKFGKKKYLRIIVE